MPVIVQPTIAEICDAVAQTLGAAVGIERSYSFDEVPEDYQDLPSLVVTPLSGETDTFTGGGNDRHSFGAGSRVSTTMLVVDVPCAQRSHIDENVARVVHTLDAVLAVLRAQRGTLYGAESGIRAHRWRWERMTWEARSEQGVAYEGFRIILTVWTYQ